MTHRLRSRLFTLPAPSIGLALALAVALPLAACTTQTQQRPAAVRSPEEIQARAMCEDMIADDVRRQGGETMIESCVVLRLREIRAGLR